MAPLVFFLAVFTPPVGLGLTALIALKGLARAASLVLVLATLGVIFATFASGCVFDGGDCNETVEALALGFWVASIIGCFYWLLTFFVFPEH